MSYKKRLELELHLKIIRDSLWNRYDFVSIRFLLKEALAISLSTSPLSSQLDLLGSVNLEYQSLNLLIEKCELIL